MNSRVADKPQRVGAEALTRKYRNARRLHASRRERNARVRECSQDKEYATKLDAFAARISVDKLARVLLHRLCPIASFASTVLARTARSLRSGYSADIPSLSCQLIRRHCSQVATTCINPRRGDDAIVMLALNLTSLSLSESQAQKSGTHSAYYVALHLAARGKISGALVTRKRFRSRLAGNDKEAASSLLPARARAFIPNARSLRPRFHASEPAGSEAKSDRDSARLPCCANSAHLTLNPSFARSISQANDKRGRRTSIAGVIAPASLERSAKRKAQQVWTE